jgi:ATP-dependent exoDNAse (exonuclease V) beta subunit
MTRSIRKCHLIATIKPNKNNELNPSGKSLLALLWPNLAAQFAAATPVANNKQTQARLADFTPKLMRLNSPAVPDLLKNLPKMQSPAPLLNPQTQQILPALNLAADVGSLAHLYMEMIANEGLEKWPASRMDASVQSMQFWLLQRGHAKNEVEKYVVNIINALKQTIASLQGAWILAPRASSQAELSVTSMSENELQEHRIDLTFVENEVRWIIDYKFGLEVNVDNANAVAQTHQPQLARYAALFTHENLPIKTAVFFLSLAKLIVL